MVEERNTIRASDVQGLKYLKKLLPLLEELHDVGCQRDRAGNRKLHYDQYGVLVLLFLFSPVMRSLRALQQASTLRKVQRKLGVVRTWDRSRKRPTSSIPSDCRESSAA